MKHVELTDELIGILKQFGIKPYEISHLKNGTTHKIGKDRLKAITKILNSKIIDSSEWIPFDGDKKHEGKVLIEPIKFERY